MGETSTYQALPVSGLEHIEGKWSSRTREVCGTAFTLGGGAYLTAGHVWKQALTHPIQALGMMDAPDSGTFKNVKIRDAEVLAGYDLAILKAPPFGKSAPWSAQPVALLDTVQAFGY